MEANALQEIDLTVDALRDGHATLNPSILIGHPSKNSNGGCEGWHGYLTDGVLVACE